MITVMFPTGLRVQYNNVHHVQWWTDYAGATLREKKDGLVIANVSFKGGAILEWHAPCAVTAPPIANAKDALQFLMHELNRGPITGWKEEVLLRELKLKLARFDARKKVWR